ncbi:MAG TPA: hypothetical protein VNM48_14740 [Chloroflexota bacterium]|nr:hypothetical protein [Chloroflexota bacterium]
MATTLSYQDQVRKRADRATALEAEVAQLRRQVEELSDVTALRRHLQAVVDAAPGAGDVDWKRPTEWTGFTIAEWEWLDGNTPEKFEAALDAADKYLHGIEDDETQPVTVAQSNKKSVLDEGAFDPGAPQSADDWNATHRDPDGP